MRLLRPRNRVVYFRLSEDEYNRCLKLCETGQAHSISDLARTAMAHWLAEEPSARPGWQHRLQNIEEKLEFMNASLDRLLGPASDMRAKPAKPARIKGMLRAKA